MRIALTALILIAALVSSLGFTPAAVTDPLRLPEEKHLRHIRQLSFGGENATKSVIGDTACTQHDHASKRPDRT